jgi:hypothetical protein
MFLSPWIRSGHSLPTRTGNATGWVAGGEVDARGSLRKSSQADISLSFVADRARPDDYDFVTDA